MKQLLILFLCYLPIQGSSQIFDQDSVFFLEKKTLSWGKSISRENKNAIVGFTGRVGTGFMHNDNPGFGGFQQVSTVPVALEFGYRFIFLELNYRYGLSGAGLGQDNSFLNELPGDGILASYLLPVNVGMKSHIGIVKWHLKLLKVPMFLQFGTGVSTSEFSNKPITEIFYVDGSKKYIYNPRFTSFTEPLETRNRIWGLGFSKGHFWCSYEMWRHKGKSNTLFEGYRLRQQAMYIGVQLNTSENKEKPLERAKKRARIRLGISKIATMAPWRRAGSGSGWSVDGTVHLNPKYHICGSFQFNNNGFGFDKYVPESDDQAFLFLPNTAGYIKRHTLLLGRTINPARPVKAFLSLGPGYYYLDNDYGSYIEPLPAPNIKENYALKSFGFTFGGGLRYKFLQSNLLFHKSIRTIPFYMEWNMGGCFVF